MYSRLCINCLRNRLVGGEGGNEQPPPLHTHTHSVAKTTVHFSPGSSMVVANVWQNFRPLLDVHCSCLRGTGLKHASEGIWRCGWGMGVLSMEDDNPFSCSLKEFAPCRNVARHALEPLLNYNSVIYCITEQSITVSML
jgi:hypothetical protein